MFTMNNRGLRATQKPYRVAARHCRNHGDRRKSSEARQRSGRPRQISSLCYVEASKITSPQNNSRPHATHRAIPGYSGLFRLISTYFDLSKIKMDFICVNSCRAVSSRHSLATAEASAKADALFCGCPCLRTARDIQSPTHPPHSTLCTRNFALKSSSLILANPR